MLPLNLYNAWGFGPDDVWAVGYRDATIDATRVGLVIHWDGAAWSISAQDLPDWVSGVWGSAPDDVWAGGSNGALYHWNGQSWTAVESGTARGIYDLWGSGPDDVWAVAGAGTILHWDGARWSSTSTGEAVDVFRGVGRGRGGCLGGRELADVFRVGPSLGRRGVVRHRRGRGDLGFTGVWGSGPADVWVVGRRGEIVHWDGAAWTRTPSVTGEWLSDVWGAGPPTFGPSARRGLSALERRRLVFGRRRGRSRSASGDAAPPTSGLPVAGDVLHWDGTIWTRNADEGLH